MLVDSSLAPRADSSGMRLCLRLAGPNGEVMLGAAMEGERRRRAELRGACGVENGCPARALRATACSEVRRRDDDGGGGERESEGERPAAVADGDRPTAAATGPSPGS